MTILNLIRANPQAAAKLAFTRGSSFALGWNEGVRRYDGHKATSIIGPSAFDPSVDPTAYAASQAAVAYCIAMEKTR